MGTFSLLNIRVMTHNNDNLCDQLRSEKKVIDMRLTPLGAPLNAMSREFSGPRTFKSIYATHESIYSFQRMMQ
jgi:hypothetical protein